MRGAKRGIQANGRGLTLEDSVITDIFRVGQESAGIGAWDSPGPFTIRRNVIQAASINFLFGGAWAQGQTAYGLVLAVRNQEGGCP